MATPQTLMKELTHIAELATSQIEGGLAPEDVAEAQFELVRNKIRLLRNVDYESVTSITKLICSCANEIQWSKDQIRDLTVAVNQRLTATGARGSGGIRLRRDNQVCNTFELYLTEDDIAKLNDVRLSDLAHISTMRHRAKLIGLHFASEPTKGRIAMIINYLAKGGELQGEEWHTHS